MKKLFYLTLIIFLNSFLGLSQRTTEINSLDMAAQAWGYLYSQNLNLEKIKTEYPELFNQVLFAEVGFNRSFGNVEKNVKAYFAKSFGETFKDTLEIYFKTKYQDLNLIVVNDIQSAKLFINEVQQRANGNIASPFLEIFLAFQFMDEPHSEFFENYTYAYSTEGHKKSLGANWKIDVPISWKAYEGDRPHVVQKFISHYGNGTESSVASVAVMMNNLPIIEGHQLTSSDMENFNLEDSAHKFVEKGSELLSFKNFNIEGYKGYILTSDYQSERMSFFVKMRVQQIGLFIDDKFYCLIFTVSPKDSDQDLSIEFDKYQPLFTLITNSIVLVDKY